MPKYIEFALVLLFLPEFSYNQLAVLTQYCSDSQAGVCYSFFKNSQLFFRISGSLRLDRCGSMMYMSGEASFIVWVDWNTDSLSSLGRPILWNSMTLTSFVFTELANTMKYGGGVLYNNLVFTYSDVTAFHRMKDGGGGVIHSCSHRVTSLRFT